MSNAVKIKPDLGCQPIECRPIEKCLHTLFLLGFLKGQFCDRPFAPRMLQIGE